jgi:Spy/CpxP family protein refolding chaperone
MAWIQTRWKAVLMVLAIFAAGVLCGVVGHRALIMRSLFPGPPMRPEGGGMPDRLLERFSRNLDLTDQQQAELGRILEESREKMMAHRRDVHLDMEQISVQTHEAIRAILTEEQLGQFEESFKRFFRGDRGRGPGRGRKGRRPPHPG